MHQSLQEQTLWGYKPCRYGYNETLRNTPRYYNLSRYDVIIIDEASMVADDTFNMVHDSLENKSIVH